LLKAQNILKTFRDPEGSVHSILELSEIHLNVGEQIFLKGDSGSGKTTLLNVLAGILKPDRGQVELDGQDIWQLSEAKRDLYRAQKIGIIFQTFHLLPGLTALENVMLGMHFSGKVDQQHAKSLLDQVGMGSRLHHTPSKLSVGQQQRVAVARALANTPKIVLADEPTGSLDPQMALVAMESIQSLCHEHQAALIWVSHNPKQASQFDRSLDLSELNHASKKQEVEI
jgi:putative ABC transport system ATP-binding protein